MASLFSAFSWLLGEYSGLVLILKCGVYSTERREGRERLLFEQMISYQEGNLCSTTCDHGESCAGNNECLLKGNKYVIGDMNIFKLRYHPHTEQLLATDLSVHNS